jgi:hypothetical protein
VDVGDVLLSVYRTAFDPEHPDFWGLAPKNRATQLSVEASLVGWTLWRLGDKFVEKLTSDERRNVQNWLASCTQVPERNSNHAWFTAINQAARLKLSARYPEFQGDEKWMLEDLKALDALYQPNNDGWYSDAPDLKVYDYYNFFVFPNFPLYWGQVIGERYADWNEKFRKRVGEFLEKTPYFFGADGAHPLYGRSLIYRWAVLAPLAAGYQEKLWPHSAGLLKRIVRKSLEYHWNLGAFDAELGKLRETYSARGCAEVRENYIDNGHPYWCMQAFSILGLAENDPFWTAAEEALPVEKSDFVVKFAGPKMVLAGTQRSGQVKWVQAMPQTRRDYYRDKYMKFAASSQFPFDLMPAKERIPLDQMLVFRTSKGMYGRTNTESGELTENGVTTKWSVKVADAVVKVRTKIALHDEFELRTHEIETDKDIDAEVVEGSYALGLKEHEAHRVDRVENRVIARTADGGAVAAMWNVSGFDDVEATEPGRTNVVYAKSVVPAWKAKLKRGKMTLVSLQYASRKPLDEAVMLARANEILQAREKTR